MGRRDLAEKFLSAAGATQPRNATMHYALGVVLEEEGKLQEATREFKRSIELDVAPEALSEAGRNLP